MLDYHSHLSYLRPSLLTAAVFALCLTMGVTPAPAEDAVESIWLNESSLYADAVVVHDQALVHSGLILPIGNFGEIAEGDFKAQLSQLGTNIRRISQPVDKKHHKVLIRYHLASEEHLNYMNGEVKKHAGPADHSRPIPVMTLVVSPLPHPEALVGAEIIFATENQYKEVTYLPTFLKEHRLTVLPRGRAIYISGQLEKGDGTIETARLTMEGLHKTLEHIGLDASHVVSIRTFLDPMSKVGEVDEVVNSFYTGDMKPSITHMEWKTTDSIEIEMVVFAPDDVRIEGADSKQSVQHFWLPWLTVSPVYCRWTLVNSPDRIYIDDILAQNTATHEEEIHEIFGKMKEILTATGSDFNHLAKATYYTTNAEVSKPFGQIRPEYYDPEHPPAASLARVQGIDGKSNSIAIDMIAAPASK
ncbi:Endoribonuclease L-PSP [Polystyrenella longa]|uniref:Endoribonuclease L-PSP n=1 Tax=Polystyrenella longa TaxID=2528007 RepID=A0A518CPR6_9PLAN|nr:RidA family protein [Polystyrenella longa]QDU81208.1 Endoribonuclease L-PSP [Polystyrenella longa]